MLYDRGVTFGPSAHISSPVRGRVENLHRALRSFVGKSANIDAAALVSEDGLVVASALPEHIDTARVAGIAATLSASSARACRELVRGELQETIVRGDNGYAVVMGIGLGTNLVCLTDGMAKLGLVSLDMRRVAAEIRNLL